jgi:hypothetical protein
MGRVVVMMRSLTCDHDHDGLSDQSKAATPATCGDAIDVPELHT